MVTNNDNKKKYKFYTYVMEYAWLTIAVSSLVTACVDLYYHGVNSESIKFAILFALALAMFVFRRWRRQKDSN